MARKGLKHVVFAEQSTAGTYSDGIRVSPAVRVSINLTKAEGDDYGDDYVVDTEASVTGGSVEVELNHDEDEIYSFLLGHEKDGTSGVIAFDVDDEPPIVGMGFVQPATTSAGRVWIAEWINQIKFSDPNEEANTKTDSVSFNHTTITGKILIPSDGEWKSRKTFDTAADAITWVDTQAGSDIDDLVEDAETVVGEETTITNP